MIINKIAKNKIKIKSQEDLGLLYVPIKKVYKVIECPCALLEYVEEVEIQQKNVLNILILN